MQLTKYSKNRLYQSFSEWEVSKEYADPVYNYLVHGLPMGSFFTALFANDAMGAIGKSHPANTISALKNLVSWVKSSLPMDVAYGSYEVVDKWVKMPASERRDTLVKQGLIYSEQAEILLVLKDEPTAEPFLW